MGKVNDFTGRKFGKLTCIRISNTKGTPSKNNIWECLCECGNTIYVNTSNLLKQKSCGCDMNCAEARRKLEEYSFKNTNIKRITANKPNNNTSGFKGVCYIKSRNKWRASICLSGKKYDLGNYSNIEDAIQARQQAEKELFKPIIEEYNNLKEEK